MNDSDKSDRINKDDKSDKGNKDDKSDLTCDKCYKDFKTYKGKMYHIRNGVCNKNVSGVSGAFHCNKCNIGFKTKQNMEYHIYSGVCTKNANANATSTKGTTNNTNTTNTTNTTNNNKKCETCNHEFSSKRALQRHLDNNVCSKKITCNTMTINNIQNSNINNSIQSIQSIQNSTIQNIDNSTINTVQNIDNSTQINLTCNYNGHPILQHSYKSSDKKGKQIPFFDAIDAQMFGDHIGSIIRDSLTKHNESIEHTIQKINCNPEYPIYNNIHTTQSLLRNNLCEIFNGETYKTIPKNRGIDTLITSHINLIDKYIEDNPDLFDSEKGRRDVEQYRAYVRSITNLTFRGSKSSSKRDLKDAVVGMLLDISKSINTPQWLEDLQKQYLIYYQKEQLRSEMLKDQTQIVKMFGINNSTFIIEVLHKGVNKLCENEITQPLARYALECINSGTKVEWDRVFEK